MSLSHPRTAAWEERLRALFREVDREMEARHGGRYPRHPRRPAADATEDFEASGLFDIGAAFSPGYGSNRGRGYIIQFRLGTLSRVPEAERQALEDEAITRVRAALPRHFPGARLDVVRDGEVWKILGDLSLGSA